MAEEKKGPAASAAKATATAPASLSWGLGLWADTVLCFLFYCVLAELPNRIFFPALVEMGFSGLEVLLGVHLFCILIGVNFLWRQMAARNWFFLLLSLPAFYFYGTIENHYERSIYIGVAVVLLSFAVFAPLFSSNERAQRMLWGHNLSFLFLVCLRYAFKSALPVWSFHKNSVPDWAGLPDWSFQIPECDKWAAVAGLLAAAILAIEPQVPMDPSTKQATLSWVLPASAHGCLQFLCFWLYSQASVVPRWVGADPLQWAPAVILALFAGYFLTTRSRAQSMLFSFLGVAGSYMLFYEAPLPAMVGGLMLAVFCASSWAVTVSSLSLHKETKGRAMMLSQFIFFFGEFITVWNIAYMFLDIGDAFREAPHYPLFFCVAVIALNNIVQGTPFVSTPTPYKALFVMLLLVFGPSLYVRHTYAVTHPHKVEHKDNEVKVMIWNVHTGYADNGYDNYLLGTRFIQDMKAGVVAILENDQARLCTGNRDQIEFFGASLGFPYHSYGVQTRESTWGCAFISLYPIKASNITVLPSPYGTRSCLIDAILDVNGNDFNLVVSHFSTEEFPEDLRLQTSKLSALAQTRNTMPMSVLCYITSAPDSATWKRADHRENYHTLVTKGTLQDPDPSDHDRWCQYIFYKNTKVMRYYHVDTGYMSDTEAQLADISTVPLCRERGDEQTCEKAEPITAEFYKYFVPSRKLKHWYTGAKFSRDRPRISDD
eukprot:comp24242_c0_seq1/m.44843 comp24242_c0_seq1/g.44843  ORF comp24242_c0_seq1/g.44843 comp24242_c0_seq1/m.44843 type:complete len:714 (-) comp24242_c0_seq1:197-2338(-)